MDVNNESKSHRCERSPFWYLWVYSIPHASTQTSTQTQACVCMHATFTLPCLRSWNPCYFLSAGVSAAFLVKICGLFLLPDTRTYRHFGSLEMSGEGLYWWDQWWLKTAAARVGAECESSIAYGLEIERNPTLLPPTSQWGERLKIEGMCLLASELIHHPSVLESLPKP